MRSLVLSPKSSTAIQRALRFWIERWDWESPTLFGFDKQEFELIAREWPRAAEGCDEEARLAALGALRELAFGASAVRREQLPEICGLTYDEVESLAGELVRAYDAIED